MRVREHCSFNWARSAHEEKRAEVGDHHCAECIAELKRTGYTIVDKRTGDPTVDLTKPEPKDA